MEVIGDFSQKVQNELLAQYATPLLEKKHSVCFALLRDDKEEDFSRIYRLFSKIDRALEPIANMFKTGTTLVKQAEDSDSNKKSHGVPPLHTFMIFHWAYN
ncbi:hypothetical protein GUJ93_ZPchr0013g35210 [Zizania palustris]|uniref:Cullin N-terminal domain-containing protein n=1 Tax=Zizania palustris TaxID=103762 RepID=A0A8J5WWP6_ZIZPA|nr:hypothetical protein GUJ93_ZPchr0013g35210 [Zizania palustris]